MSGACEFDNPFDGTECGRTEYLSTYLLMSNDRRITERLRTADRYSGVMRWVNVCPNCALAQLSLGQVAPAVFIDALEIESESHIVRSVN